MMVPVTSEVLHYQYETVCRWLSRRFGLIVQIGPFAGMQYTRGSRGSVYPPKLIGCYESELHPLVRRIADSGYRTIVNIGAAEGYYAVGLARLMPGATVHAFDTDPQAAPLGRALGAANGVESRVVYGTECTHARLQELLDLGSLVVCDIEGGETTLLDPVAAPALAHSDILVECHDFLPAPTSARVAERFRPTHDVTLIPNHWIDPNTVPFLRPLTPVQKFFSVWEGRPGPTPWLWMTARDRRS
jgi:hypothetical protein